MDELLREFIAETNEHLAAFARDLVALERAPDNRALIDDIFRNVHSIKGTCSFLGLNRLESLLHTVEDVLGKLRDGTLPPASISTAIGVLLRAGDRAKTILAALTQDGHEPEGGDADIGARLELALVQHPSQMTGDLRQGVPETRKRPIGQAWTKLPRMLRDLERELGKKIALKLEGGEIEVDNDVLRLVKDPFTHLMRNAADHGIETPSERRRAGKTETGLISLSARHENSAFVVALADDGRGIDPERIRIAIRRAGLATDPELDAMSAHRLLQFIFHPGLTTASQVTNISGRGVGLDVVRSNIEKIGGAVDVESDLGRGTRFTISLRLTAAIGTMDTTESVRARRGLPQRRAAS
ncbi:MAG TPA: ATP-binding protein [Stellaceae bacterium]|jgi:chemotaxis protein histidine kinase CheA|nr:ATP-binding protein [Stellaceae bacterium]